MNKQKKQTENQNKKNIATATITTTTKSKKRNKQNQIRNLNSIMSKLFSGAYVAQKILSGYAPSSLASLTS